MVRILEVGNLKNTKEDVLLSHHLRPDAVLYKKLPPQVEPPAEGQSLMHRMCEGGWGGGKLVEAWKHSDFLCHNYVLNGLIDPLYNVYCKTTTAKELWESLERKYKTEDAGTKKFVVARFLDYKMVDSKSVVSQVQDLQVLLHDIHAEGMTLSETFQVAAIIEKLPPSWVEFKNYLKHKSSGDLLKSVEPPGHRLPGRAVDNGQKLYMGNSATADIKGEGDVILKMTSEKELKLTNVLYVPEIRKNLVSGWLLNKFGFRLVFESDKFVLSKNQMYVGKGYAVDAMFKLNVMVVKNDINKMNSSAYLIESSNVWHGRLGHPNLQEHLSNRLSEQPNLDMIHTDICDLKSLPTKGGNKYFITFIDDCTKYCYVYLLKSKDEAIDKFVLYKTEVENQLGKKIKVVRSDRGGEYVAPFAELCAKHGIRHEFTAPYSPQQNGIAERKNRTLKEYGISPC
ncbi:pol polyprotein [Tanacetum coccineum]|uniref:Pol polyprotein n=1 Tax=Tanacetum coccineum TaxID=301880 RepID=A0ABQ5EX93_9ASTR